MVRSLEMRARWILAVLLIAACVGSDPTAGGNGEGDAGTDGSSGDGSGGDLPPCVLDRERLGACRL